MKDIMNLKNLDVKREYQTLRSIINTFLKNYKAKNPWKIRLIDSFIAFSVVIFIIQFIYIVVAGLFPLNSIISGLLCSLGTITLLASLRLQFNPSSKMDNYSNEKVFAEFLVASFIFYFVCFNFVG